MAHPKHEAVRRRFEHRCGYCGVSEAESGGELTVDHFRPVSARGDEGDANLIYACFRCNGYKADFVPSAEDLKAGRRLLHPLVDSVAEHVREDPATGRLEPLTETGRFHIEILRLNRPELVDCRTRKTLARLLAARCELLQKENEVLRRRLDAIRDYLQQLVRAP